MIEMPQNTAKRDRISKKDRTRLIETKEPYCISIYIPTHPTGEEVFQDQDAQSFKVRLREIRKELESTPLSAGEIDERLEPLEALQRDGAFWREQSAGLAVFTTANWFKYFRLPISFMPRHYISAHFHIMPMLEELRAPGNFSLLSLELERIRFFKGNRYGLEEIDIRDLVPARKEDRVGYDFEQKGLQFRSQHQAHAAAGYHGHDEADRDRKNEIKRFFREVDSGIQPLLHETGAPLVIASQDYLAAIFREVSSYGDIVEQPIEVNLSEAPDRELLENALELLEQAFGKDADQKWELFKQYHGTGKASGDLSLILPAAFQGRVDTLFLDTGSEVWGMVDDNTLEATIDEDPDAFSESLLNRAAIETLQNGGLVFAIKPEELQDNPVPALALFRY